MVYFDTSVLAALFKGEMANAAVERFIDRLPVGDATISSWTRVEFASLLAKEVRMGGLSSSEAHAIDARFEATIQASFTILAVTAADFDLARIRLADHRSGLRSGDALHLAIAVNNQVRNLCSFDKVLMRNARASGLPVNIGLPANTA